MGLFKAKLSNALHIQIYDMAKFYLSDRSITLKMVGEKFGVSQTTVRRYFKTYLPEISKFTSWRVSRKSKKAKARVLGNVNNFKK